MNGASEAESDAYSLRIALLGPPAVTCASQPLAIPRRQARALLYRLAISRRPVAREQLCFLFWPDTPESDARRSLAHLLTHLRRSLPEPGLVLAATDQVGLDAARVWSDTAAFERLIATAEPRRRAAALQQAVALARGPFLEGFALPGSREFEEWAAQERQTWERRAQEALAALIEHHTARGAYADAIAAAQRYLAADELAEDIHRRLIALYAAAGDRSASERFERLMVRPGSQVVLVFGLITAWLQGQPILGFLQGATANWLLASLVLFLSSVPLVVLVLIPRSKLRARAVEAALAQGAITPELRAALADRAVIASRNAELLIVAVIVVLMALKPF